MRQVLFEIPGLHVKIFGYGLFLVLALVGSVGLAAWRARRERLDPELFYDLAVWLILGGLVGARVFFVAQYWRTTVHSLLDVFKIWEGGIVLYGSILGGLAAFLLYRRLRPFPLLPALDVIAPSLALGIAIGRLGCFMNGCCYGDPCDLPWAVAFPGPRVGVPGDPALPIPGSPPWANQVREGRIPESADWSLPTHPTQLYSALDGLILCLLLSAYFPIRRRDGEVMALLMLTYPITRFLIEWLRNDEAAFLSGLTISQAISVIVLLGGVAFWMALARRPAARYADEADEPAAAAVP
jgi:phosphatidylglycerol:prolipoprotein diacylglycerol transferase